jgi:hypothetical protein
MAESTKTKSAAERESSGAGDSASAGAPNPASTPQAHNTTPQAQSVIQINDSRALACYANFCRATGTPEELILDFGLNAEPFGKPEKPVEIKQRLVVNYLTAKRLMQALAMSVQRHEQAFGVLETDVQKRVTPAARRSE